MTPHKPKPESMLGTTVVHKASAIGRLPPSGYSGTEARFSPVIGRRPSAYHGGNIRKPRSGNRGTGKPVKFPSDLLTNQDLRRRIIVVFRP